jgi:hypothetical protein
MGRTGLKVWHRNQRCHLQKKAACAISIAQAFNLDDNGEFPLGGEAGRRKEGRSETNTYFMLTVFHACQVLWKHSLI